MPLRSGRASKACELCRRHKTRCYASQSTRGSCLRCTTLRQTCSLSAEIVEPRDSSCLQSHNSVDNRLNRLEKIVETLVDRLDSIVPVSADHAQTRGAASTSDADTNAAPVFLIRDAATDAGVHSPEVAQSDNASSRSDVISTKLVTLATAYSLTDIFHIHYGRWVKFPEDISTTALLSSIRKSPLLVSSVFLIAVRHTTQELADRLAPKLFQEARTLVASSLLVAPQSIEFFQAVLILSLWSTTIGQVPMSVDSWLLTGYALQQALASPNFVKVFQASSALPISASQMDVWCLWNHICLAHLQYCVGTRRQALLNQEQIDHCVRFIQADNITNYESRMIAEVNLYWIIHGKCCGSEVNLSQAKLALEGWRQKWSVLFEQPRSQFIQMGFHFAYLLAYGQFLKSPTALRGGPTVVESTVIEMIKRSTAIINLAIETTDERTCHLTDQIYHIITFAGLTLCRLVHSYESKLNDVESLDNLVTELVQWLKSIGLPCHAAHMLGNILSAQFSKLRPHVRQAVDADSQAGEIDFTAFDGQYLSNSVGDLYPDFMGSDFLNVAMDAAPWPQWDEIYPDSTIQ